MYPTKNEQEARILPCSVVYFDYLTFCWATALHIIFKAPTLQTFIYTKNQKLQADLKMTVCYPNKQIQLQDQHICCNSYHTAISYAR